MSQALNIRQATPDDLEDLLTLYGHMGQSDAPCPSAKARTIFSRFLRYDGSAILLGMLGGKLMSSCTLVIIPNLTRLGTPYALIENVVTDVGYRNHGYGKLILNAAVAHAWEHDCYKVMLMTGSHEPATLAFYESAGFAQSKTGFQKRRKAQ